MAKTKQNQTKPNKTKQNQTKPNKNKQQQTKTNKNKQKQTKGNDLYITLTESKKTFNDDGRDNYQKHKIFLYKEDFEKFREGLEDVLLKIDELRATGEYASDDSSVESYSSVSFDDL